VSESEYFARFRPHPADEPLWGAVRGDRLEALCCAPWRDGARPTGAWYRADEVEWQPPAEPSKIVALGYNFQDLFLDAAALSRSDEPHFRDPGFEPMVFLKAPNALSAHRWPIVHHRIVEEVWVEVEIAAVIGRRARDLATREGARAAVFGITIANDVSAPNVLNRDWHLARSKSLDGFCPVGPVLKRGVDEAPLWMRTRVNGRETQSASSANRILDTLESVIFVSRLITLEPGDLVLTGTPRGARQSVVRPGDRVEMEIEGLGALVNPVVRSGEAGAEGGGEVMRSREAVPAAEGAVAG
jgi:2-keto-4-pentenoate hydratase/2-oxohepta-3-ene-1,7-dioic acid hydratase in catechol pathway